MRTLARPRHRRLASVGMVTLLALSLIHCGDSPPSMSTDEAAEIAREAFVYGFPLVMNYKTLYEYALNESSPDYKGPFNEVSCAARLFTPEDRAVVTPNADTPYCMFWMNLRAEPLVLSVPEMDGERYYSFQLIDLYTHNYAYVGTLTTGNDAGRFLLAGPDWQGDEPDGISGVIRSETGIVFAVARTQLFGPDDLDRVREIQEAYRLEPLSAVLGTTPPQALELPDLPDWVEGSQFDHRFFAYLDLMLDLIEEPVAEEAALWERFARLGLGPDNDFDYAALSPEMQQALATGAESGMADIERVIRELSSDPLASAKVAGTREFLAASARDNFGHATHFLIRAGVAQQGIYANSGDEAIYPTYLTDVDGQPFDGSATSYTVTFAAEDLPPVKAFWSLTMYDGATQLFVPNPLERYLLNSTTMDDFRFESDGSLVLHVSAESPGKAREANWLPAPPGPFYMVLRLYGPESTALDGEWTPPPVVRVE